MLSFYWVNTDNWHFVPELTLCQTTNYRSSKLKEFADDNFKFDENGEIFSKGLKNTVGKGEIGRYEQFLLFPHCFQKICTADTEKPGLLWERDVFYLSCD